MSKIDDMRAATTKAHETIRYQAIERKVKSGECQILNVWKTHSTVTDDDFLKGVEWILKDPFDERNRLTREIALSPTGIVYLDRIYDDWHGMMVFSHNGQTWKGELFEVETEEKYKKMYGDTFMRSFELRLNAKDPIY